MRRITQEVLVNKFQPEDRQQHLVPNVIHRQFFQILRKARFYLRIQPDYSPDFDEGDEQDDLCRITGQRHDPCLLDTFIAAVRFMEGDPKRRGGNTRRNGSE
jgi:hypothetical protein